MVNTLDVSHLVFTPVSIPDLGSALKKLPTSGNVKFTDDGLVYADIDDDYIHQIYPLIYHNGLKKPDYFDKKTHCIGAHISISILKKMLLLILISLKR